MWRRRASAVVAGVVVAVGLTWAPAEAQTTGSFGATGAGTTSGVLSASQLWATKYTSTVAATATAIRVYVTGGTGSQVFRLVAYADSSGKPGAKLFETGEGTVAANQAAGWVSLTASGTIAASTPYWLAIWTGAVTGGTGPAWSHSVTTAAFSQLVTPATYGTSAPASMGGSFDQTRLHSLAVDYSVAATTTTAAPTTTTTAATTTTTSGPTTTTTTVPGVDPASWVDLTNCGVVGTGPCGGVFRSWGSSGVTPSATWTFYRAGGNVYVHPINISLAVDTGPLCLHKAGDSYSRFNHTGEVINGTPATFTIATSGNDVEISNGAANGGASGIAEIFNGLYAYRVGLNVACEASTDPKALSLIVPPPAITCSREWFTSSSGALSVRVRMLIDNPHEGATDIPTIRFPWESTDRTGLLAVSEVPFASMPTGGWVGICKLVRNVKAGYTGSGAWRQGAVSEQDVPVEVMDDYRRASVVTPSVIPDTQTLQTYIIPPGTFAGAAAVTAPGTSAGAYILGIPAAGIFGWSVGGWIAGKAKWEGDDGWFCRYNPGYKLARSSYCDALLAEEKYLRAQVQMRDAAGNTLNGTSTATWTSATAIAEVLIDPERPAIGDVTTTAIELQPQTAPQRTATETEVTTATDPEAGQERAKRQLAEGTVTVDERPAPEPSPTTGIETTAVDPEDPDPDPDPQLSSGCNQSFWSILNPLNIAETMGCVLIRLFVPTDLSAITKLWGDIKTKEPFSLLYDVVTFPGWAADQLHTGVSANACLSLSAGIPGSESTDTQMCSDGSGGATDFLGSARVQLKSTFGIALVIAVALCVFSLITRVVNSG